MKEKLIKLEDLLRGESLLARRALGLIRAKKQAIISNDIAAIDSLTKEEHSVIEKAEELGYRRQDLVLTTTREDKSLRITEHLRDFLAQLPGDLNSRLMDLRAELLQAYKAISEESKLNGELLAQSMKVTQHLFDRFSSIDSRLRKGRTNYGRAGYGKARNGQPAMFGQEG